MSYDKFFGRAFRSIFFAVASFFAWSFGWLFASSPPTHDLESFARLVSVPAVVARFKAFASRALGHPRYIAGGFRLERSII